MPSQPSVLHDHWTTVNGQRIFARISNPPTTTNLPIVLVHGLGVSGRYLVPTAELLAPRHFVAIPDLPGWGVSTDPRRVLNLNDLADVLADWMTAVGIDRAIMLGNSFGCQIIVDFALRHPERIAQAVLVGPSGDPARESPINLLFRLALDALRERPSHVLFTIRDYLRFGPRRGIKTFKIMLDDQIEDKLPQLTIPTLVVRGEQDPIVSQEWVEQMAALIPRAESAVIPAAAHAVNADAPEALAKVVERFLTTQTEKPVTP